jgi:hypothetical protein
MTCEWFVWAALRTPLEPAARSNLIGPASRPRLGIRWSCIRAIEPEEQCDQRAARQQELDSQVGAERAAGCDYFQCKRFHEVCPVVRFRYRLWVSNRNIWTSFA